MQILRADPIHPVRKRLWQGAIAVAVFLSVIIGREVFVRNTDGSHRLTLGLDLLPVYAAGQLVREGRAAELYDLAPIAQIERRTVAEADLDSLPWYGPYLNPPFFAAAYAPLSMLPYRGAAAVWLGINFLMLAAIILLLCRMLPPDCGWRCWGLIPFLLILPNPFWQAMCHQQNTLLALLILGGVVNLWRSQRDSKVRPMFCGMLAGLLFYKPQLACVVAAALTITLGWRAFVGLGITGLSLLLVNVVTMPGSLTAFLHKMPPMVNWMQTHFVYNWGRQVNPLGFWRLLIQGRGMGLTALLPRMLALASVAATALALTVALVRFRLGERNETSLDRIIGATIVCMPLLMPYYMDYDLLILTIPVVLFAAEWMDGQGHSAEVGRQKGMQDRLLLTAFVALFFSLYINPGLAAQTRLSVVVPMLGLVTGAAIARCLRRPVATTQAKQYDDLRLAA